MYDCHPKRRNRRAQLLVLLFVTLAALSFTVSAFLPRFASIPQIFGLFLLVPAIQIAARYTVVSYLYRLRPIEGTDDADFEVYTYRGGAKMQLVCRTALSEIRAVTPLTKENRRPPHGIRRYHYEVDLCPREAMVVSLVTADGPCEILLSPDEKLFEIFETAAVKNACPAADPDPKAHAGEDETENP